MSFRGTFSGLGGDQDVRYVHYELSRDTDSKGRPASGVYGGRITLEVESTESTDIIEAMVNSQFKPFEGSVTFKKLEEDAKMKELTFANAYIVFFSETLDVNGELPMRIRFTISAEEITIGNATHENRWPTA